MDVLARHEALWPLPLSETSDIAIFRKRTRRSSHLVPLVALVEFLLSQGSAHVRPSPSPFRKISSITRDSSHPLCEGGKGGGGRYGLHRMHRPRRVCLRWRRPNISRAGPHKLRRARASSPRIARSREGCLHRYLPLEKPAAVTSINLDRDRYPAGSFSLSLLLSSRSSRFRASGFYRRDREIGD